jgi:hypothetical protein
LTFLLFLKMADEQAKPPFGKASPIPKVSDGMRPLNRFRFAWQPVLSLS